MEDKNVTKKQEDENLNLGNGGNGLDDQKDQKTTYTVEEVEEIKKKMQSDSEKGVQKILSKNKIYENAFEHLSHIGDNPAYLVQLHSDNPEVAQIILKNYYNGQTLEEYKESIEYEEDYTDPNVIKEMITKEANKLATNKEMEASKKAFIDKLGLQGQELQDFEEAFEERKALKSFKADDVSKHLEKAYLEIADLESLSNLKQKSLIGKVMTKTDARNSEGKNVNSKKVSIDNEINEFNKKFNI